MAPVILQVVAAVILEVMAVVILELMAAVILDIQDTLPVIIREVSISCHLVLVLAGLMDL
jgi:hypothetical protein